MDAGPATSLLTFTARTRPTRVAFLVDATPASLPYLEKVFGYSVGYWGGRLHGVFPVVDGAIHNGWWSTLHLLDPDVIVTNTDLTDACLRRIERFVLPSQYLGLTASERDRTTHPYVPIHGLDLLSIAPIPQTIWASRGPLSEPNFIKFKWRQPIDNVQQVILRNFGALPDDIQTEAAFRDLPVHDMNNPTPNLATLFSRLTEIGNKAVFPVDLASFGAGFPGQLDYDPSYNEFHLVIGDSCYDSIYAWNRIFTSNRQYGRLTLWLPEAIAEDGSALDSLKEWLQRAFVQSGIERTVRLVSFTLQDNLLSHLCTRLSDGGRTYFRHLHIQPKDFAPLKGSPRHSFIGSSFGFASNPLNVHVSKWQQPFADGQTLVDVPRPPFAARSTNGGTWMMDLRVQFHPDRYHYTNIRPDWTLPKRRGLAELFLEANNSRIVNGGLLSFQAPGAQPGVTVRIPNDRTVLGSLCVSGSKSHESIPARSVRFNDMRTSDEGAILRGMLTLFGGVWHCGRSFRNPFWRATLSDMAKEPAGYRKRWCTLAKLKQQYGNLRSAAPKEGMESDYWKAVPHFDDYIRHEFDEMVERGIFQQGLEVRCLHCGGFYWYGLAHLGPRVTCFGCQESIVLPTESPWSYKLNDLVANALNLQIDPTDGCLLCALQRCDEHKLLPNKRRGTLAVVQSLLTLLNDARDGMFLFLPSQIFAEEYDGESKLELDLIAIVNDRFVIGEVKSSPLGFDKEDIDRALAIAEEFLPDEVILTAPGENWSPELISLVEDAKRKAAEVFVTLKVIPLHWQ